MVRFFQCAALIALLATLVTGAEAEEPPGQPFGSALDVSFAAKLWAALETAGLAGPQARKLEPFFGGARPHGMVLELAYQNLTVGGHSGFLVVKKNYDGDGVSVEAVGADRARYLSSMTVMYERENGYDADNQNWFWVKYAADGSVVKNPAGVALAGRVAKGKTPSENRGCIYCHRSAGGGDYIFYPQVRIPGGPP